MNNSEENKSNEIPTTVEDTYVKDDASFDEIDDEYLIKRSQLYADILEIYKTHLSDTKKIQKGYRKWIFFVFSLVLVIIVRGTFSFLNDSRISLQTTPAILGVIASLITSLMIIPSKITDFIFNSKEDEQMAKIISDIQAYDKIIRENKKHN